MANKELAMLSHSLFPACLPSVLHDIRGLQGSPGLSALQEAERRQAELQGAVQRGQGLESGPAAVLVDLGALILCSRGKVYPVGLQHAGCMRPSAEQVQALQTRNSASASFQVESGYNSNAATYGLLSVANSRKLVHTTINSTPQRLPKTRLKASKVWLALLK